MILLVQGRATEAPKPPQTQPQRRNFMVAVDSNDAQDAEDKAIEALEATRYSFITIDRVLTIKKDAADPALKTIVDEARRNGIGFAIYR